MSDFYAFAADHPLLVIILVAIICETVMVIVRGRGADDD